MKNNTLMKLLSFALLLTMFGCGRGQGKGKDKNEKAINNQADPKSILEIQGSDISGSTTKFAIKVANKDAKGEFDLKGYKLKAEVVKVNDGTDLKGVTLKYQKGGLNMSAKSITNQIETLLSDTKLAANGTSADIEFELDTKGVDSIEVKFTMTDADDKEITTKALKWTKGATQVATATITQATFKTVVEGDGKSVQNLDITIKAVNGELKIASAEFKIGNGAYTPLILSADPLVIAKDATGLLQGIFAPAEAGSPVTGESLIQAGNSITVTLTLEDGSTKNATYNTLQEVADDEEGEGEGEDEVEGE